MLYIYFDNLNPESMGFNTNEYKLFCEENNIEPTEEGECDWLEDILEEAWDDVIDDIKAYDKENWGETYYVKGRFNLWNGGYGISGVFNTLKNALNACIDSSDYVKVESSEGDGCIYVTGYHHDGNNCFTIYRLNDKGKKSLEDMDDEFIFREDEMKEAL